MVENCLIGHAKADITPKEPVKMGGYGFRKGKSTDVHDKLFAHAVYFSFKVLIEKQLKGLLVSHRKISSYIVSIIILDRILLV